MKKKCPGCGKLKSISEFHSDRHNKKWGVHSYCKKCISIKMKKAYRQDLIKSRQRVKEQYYKHKEAKCRRARAYFKTKNGKYGQYYRNAKNRNLEFRLTKKEFLSFWEKDCYYCGKQVQGVGIDRLDNKKGYTLKNCVVCCFVCNKMKMEMTPTEFVKKCNQITKKRGGV